MSSTASNYYSRVNQNYPVKGQDNDSQGFRDNFKNLVKAIESVDITVDDLSLNTVRVDQPANFGGNTIRNANLENTSITLVDNGVITSSLITIDYTRGSYQKFNLSAGLHQLTIENWPSDGKTGNMRLAVTPSSTSYTAIEFPGNLLVNLGPEENPYEITPNTTNIFDIWNESDTGTIYVKKVSQHVFSTLTNTSTILTDTLILGQTNRYTTGTTTGTFFATQVQANSKIANLGLVPNRVTTYVTTEETDSPGDTIATRFGVASAKGIYQGATVNFINTFTTYVVSVVDNVTNKITTTEPFPVGIGFGEVTFTNPTFNDQPTLVTLVNNAANTFTGSIANYAGSIYAEKHKLEVTFDAYGGTANAQTTNTFVIETLADSTATNNFEKILADTTFIHSLLPCGSIIMWWGRKDKIPYGWALCDGNTATNLTTGEIIVTPNLIDKFVVGGGADYFGSDGKWSGTTSTVTGKALPEGGVADSIVVSHNHSANLNFSGETIPPHEHSVIINDPGHNHLLGTADSQTGIGSGPYKEFVADYPTALTVVTNTTGTGITAKTGPSAEVAITGTVTASIQPAGTSGVGMNIPPFKALYYIMKVTGPNYTGAGQYL